MRRVVITGMGAITPIGNNRKDFWNSLVEGKCGIGKIQAEEDFPIHVAAQVKDFDPKKSGLSIAEIRHSDLFSQYAVAASLEAMKDSGLESGINIEAERLGSYIGSGIGGFNTFAKQIENYNNDGYRAVSPLFIPMIIGNIAAGNTAIRINAQGPCLSPVAACATSTISIGEAYLAIRNGMADAIVAGGSEAAIHPITMAGFANCKALTRAENPLEASLPFDSRRSGFVIADGAGIVVLEEYEHAKARNAHIYAEVCGYGHTCDAYHYTAPRPDGTCTAKAISQSLQQAAYKEGESLYINAHGTGTTLNDKAETAAIKLALGTSEAHKAKISSTKSMTGHLLGAAGAIEIIASTLALVNGIVPPTIGLESPDPECDLNYTPLNAVACNIDIAISESLGFGGHNDCIALRKI